MFYTYILQSIKDKKWYTGATDDLRKRFNLHNDGKVPATKGRGPFNLIYYEACQNQGDAFAREKYLKSGPGKRYLKNRLKRFLTLTGLLTLLLFACWQPASAGTIIKSPAYLGLQKGLVGCWSFDGDFTNAPDCSGNNNTGTLTNGPTRVQGRVGQAMNFDGVDDTVSTTSDFIGTSAGTYSAWVYARSEGDDTGYGFIVTNGGAVQFGLGLCAVKTIGFTSNNASNVACGATASIAYKTWYFVTATRDSSGTANLYVNGVLSGTANQNSGTPQAGTTNVQVGNSAFTSRTWDGYLDDVRIYNRVLSPAEIQRLYRIGLGSTADRTKPINSLDRGLVGCWTFDGDYTKAPDCSGNNNTGTLINGPTRVQGKIGQGLSFDGVNDCVSIADSNSLNVTGSITTSAWIKVASNDSGFHEIVRKENATPWFLLLNSGNKIALSTTGAPIEYNDGFSYTADNQWHQVTGTFDGTTIRMYKDGVFQTSYAGGALQSGTDVAGIGGLPSVGCTNGQFFNGSIDDVRIYNRTLSPAEVKRMYDTTQSKFNSSQITNSLDRGLTGYWTFDGPDISGTRAKDRSGFNNHGTLTNGPTEVQGKIGQGLSFNGVNDDITTGKVASNFMSVSTGTMSVWLKPTGTSPTGAQYYVLQGIIGENSSINICICRGIISGSDRIWIANFDGGSNIVGIPYNNNEWIHVVWVHDNGTLYAYKNGNLVGSVAAGNTIALANFLKIGYLGVGSQYFSGSIDNARTYNRALSATEVTKLYNMGR